MTNRQHKTHNVVMPLSQPSPCLSHPHTHTLSHCTEWFWEVLLRLSFVCQTASACVRGCHIRCWHMPIVALTQAAFVCKRARMRPAGLVWGLWHRLGCRGQLLAKKTRLHARRISIVPPQRNLSLSSGLLEGLQSIRNREFRMIFGLSHERRLEHQTEGFTATSKHLLVQGDHGFCATRTFDTEDASRVQFECISVSSSIGNDLR